ncbi:N-acetyllactosaminide beta-1,3-N-acetylglucosaminyltransferase [Aphelenchoides besseyi]|nr:N-acetyllactosaminide beta-1,3-N-acetylglucosaminyltransferase [Aphelenchoides besseyi]
MRVYFFPWENLGQNTKFHCRNFIQWSRLTFELCLRRLCRKKVRSCIILFITLILLLYLRRLWIMYLTNYVDDMWVDEDITSLDCTNAQLRGIYSIHGYSPIHRVTRLKTELYKPGFCVRYNHWAISKVNLKRPSMKIPILFAVHATPQYFKHLKQQLETWDGLISLALVIPFSNDRSPMDLFRIQMILETLDRVKSSYDNSRVALHLLFEMRTNKTAECPDLIYNRPSNETLWDRSYADIMVRDLERLCASQLMYPINVARNVARLGVRTPLFVSGDIENIFSLDYERRMRPLAWNILYAANRPRKVLVHRRFEVDSRDTVPRTLTALRMIFSRSRAVEFHRYVFLVGHKIPELGAWLLLHKELDNGTATLFRTYRYLNEYWEPQYVARNDETLPLHDETFPFRFRSNTHLGSEMCRAGFTFAVVNDLFTVHVGIKRQEKKRRTSDSGELKEIAAKFMERLDRQYPLTKRACPKQFRDYLWSPNYVDPFKRRPVPLANKVVH